MSAKKKATMQEWEEIGKALKQSRRQIMDVVTLMSGKTKITYQDQAMRLITRLTRLCSDLEDEMFRQHPEEAHITVFYGEVKRSPAEV